MPNKKNRFGNGAGIESAISNYSEELYKNSPISTYPQTTQQKAQLQGLFGGGIHTSAAGVSHGGHGGSLGSPPRAQGMNWDNYSKTYGTEINPDAMEVDDMADAFERQILRIRAKLGKKQLSGKISNNEQIGAWYEGSSNLLTDAYNYWQTTTAPLGKADELEKLLQEAKKLSDYSGGTDGKGGTGTSVMSVGQNSQKYTGNQKNFLEKNGYESIEELEEAIESARGKSQYDRYYGSEYVKSLREAYDEGVKVLDYMKAHKSEYKNYDTVFSQTEAYVQNLKEMQQAMLGVRGYYQQWDNSDEYYNGLGLWDTIGETAKAGWNTMIADFVSAAATMQGQTQTDLSMGQSAMAAVEGKTYEQALNEVNSARQARATETAEKAQQYYDTASVSETLAKWKKGDLGELLVSAGIQVPAVAADTVVSIAGSAIDMPWLGLVPLAVRAYGGGAEQARAAGLDWQAQELAGFKSAAIEVASEKMFSAFGKLAYGKGYADDIIGNAIDNAASNKFVKMALHTAAAFGEEGIEEVMSDILNPALDYALGLRDQNGNLLDEVSMEQIIEDFIVGGILGLAGTGGQAIMNRASDAFIKNPKLKKIYGEFTTDLIDEAMATPEGSESRTLAKKYQSKLDAGKELSSAEISKLIKANDDAVGEENSALDEGSKEVLTLIGAPFNIKPLAAAMAKDAAGLQLTAEERDLVQRFAHAKSKPETTEASENQTETAQAGAMQPEANVNTKKTNAAPAAAQGAQSIDEYSNKYGKSASAVQRIYNLGNNIGVEKFSTAFDNAYKWGKSGVPLSYAMSSNVTSDLTEDQRKLAWQMGADNASANAASRGEKIEGGKKQGNLKRKAGTVKAENGVSLSDIRKKFNDRQNIAYKVLSTFAEATGVDVVVYSSKPDSDGNFPTAQGKFRWKDNAIYIDMNSGLFDKGDINDLGKYTALRTFAHEFTHFIEKWNPVQYNEFRSFAFQTIQERGENVDDLITEYLALDESGKLTYEQASREVVADAMTDILPDTDLVQQLAEEHKTIFDKLLEKLQEFVANIKAFYNGIKVGDTRESRALKEQVNGEIKYLDSIVKQWTSIAKTAVENYQLTFGEEITETAPAEEATAAPETEPAQQQDIVYDDFKIMNNAERGSIEIKFNEKPAENIRDILKSHKFRWGKTKGVWYGYGDAAKIGAELDAAYKEKPAEPVEAVKEVAPQEETPAEAEQERPEEIPETATVENKEETGNGKSGNNASGNRSNGQRTARLLETVQTADVQGTGEERSIVADSGTEGTGTGRNDNPDDAERSQRGYGEGSSQSADIRRDGVLSAEEETQQAAETLREEVSEQIEQQSKEQPKGSNFIIGDSLNLPSGAKARYKANIEAIKLVKQLVAEGRYATTEEQEVLSKYVGWGGLSEAFDEKKSDWAKEYAELKELLTDDEYKAARGSTLNAHYTDISVIKAMYKGLAQLGFKGGRMLEPSSGVGNFVGAMPANMSGKVTSWTMVELDNITGLIAKYLYPNADVRIQGFETAKIPDNYMDVAISNVPFGNYPIADKKYKGFLTKAIHNYFFAKSLDKVRPGGIVMFITSSFTMNSQDAQVRKYIAKQADLLGAIRLPSTAFKGNAGTEVVTDILVLRKRAPNTEYAGENFENANYQYIDGYQGAYVNDYFIQHPEMVMGKAQLTRGMYRANELTYTPFTDRGTLQEQIEKAFENIKGKMSYPAKLSPEKTNFSVDRAEKKGKPNGYVSRNGKIYIHDDNGNLQQVEKDNDSAARITGMLEVRDAARELLNAQQQGQSKESKDALRKKLNSVYDSFVKKHGYLNSAKNKKAFESDPDRYSLFALENYDSKTKTATKADIFSVDTVAPNVTVTTAENVAEGLIVSRNVTGGIDVPMIARLTSRTEADVTRELIDSRLAFKDREGELVAAEVYLSGNVRAKLRDAEALAEADDDYKNNVEALKSVMPKDVSHTDIYVNPGTPWIPASVYEEFVCHMLGVRNYSYYNNSKEVTVVHSNATGRFTIEISSSAKRSWSFETNNKQKWGINKPRHNFVDIFSAMLNSQSQTVTYKDADGKTYVDKDATALANEKVEQITQEFQKWLWSDKERTEQLTELYNEVFNAIVTPKYNGEHLTVNGANAAKPLRPHQRDAVQRVVSSGGNTLLAHKVGAGKTYEMAAAAMKLKEFGIVKKPMFIVPKSLVAQWGNEFKDFFPTAKILVAEQSDFTPANRKTFANRIATGSYDAVIVSYEQFQKIPISNDFAKELYQDEIDEVIAAINEAKEEAGKNSLSIKALEKKRKSLEAKIQALTDIEVDEDNIIFENLGIDSLFVDEAHNYKNLFYTTSMQNVSGLGNKDGSKKAFDLYTKVRYLQKLNNGRGIVFATATPVMNSMSEMYIMQKYLQPDLLKEMGIYSFDAWAKQFGEVVNGVEIKPSGQGYRVKQSFSRFKNVPELQLLFRNFADVLTDIPGLKIPKMKDGKVHVIECEPGEFQQEYMKELEKRAENVRNVNPAEDNMLKITSDGRKVSYTQRMIDPSLPYEENGKIKTCVENVARVYKESKSIKGTQLIFCDMATPKGKDKSKDTDTANTDDVVIDESSAKLYDDMRSLLVKKGVSAKEIAFIHEADTDAKKAQLFADVNEGKVRVLIGSTGKMGVGMNAQKRIVAIHHLDAPWRPGDVEQRNGRAYRQGNINAEVEDFTYVTVGSFDARLWDILDRKQNFINQIMNGEDVGRDAEDTGEVTLSAAEVKALASGNPAIMEAVQLESDIKKLESLKRAHNKSVYEAKVKLADAQAQKTSLENRIANAKKDISTRVDTYSEGKFALTVGTKKYTDKKEAGEALMLAAQEKATTEGFTTIGKFAGFELRAFKTKEGIKGLVSGAQGYGFNYTIDQTTRMVGRISNIVESLEQYVEARSKELADISKSIAEQEKLSTAEFERENELNTKRARYNEIMRELNPPEQNQQINDEDIEQYSTRRKNNDDVERYNADEYDAENASIKQQIEHSREILNQMAPVANAVVPENLFDSKDAYKLADSVFSKINYNVRRAAFGNIRISRKDISKGLRYAKTPEERAAILLVPNILKNGIDIGAHHQHKGRSKNTATFAAPVVINGIRGNMAVLVNRNSDSYNAHRIVLPDGTAFKFSGKKIDTSSERSQGVLENESLAKTADAVSDAIIDETSDFVNTDDQYSTRRKMLSNREVLAMAADSIQIDDLTDGQKDAIRIFNSRLDKLEDMTAQRESLGQQYKEQQFTKGGSRAEAERIKERMDELDGKINAAQNDLLDLEDKEVLKQVLVKARKVIETEERAQSVERLKRYRESRDEVSSVKKYRAKVRADVETLRSWLMRPNNKDVRQHIPAEIQKSVADFIGSINFISKRALNGKDYTQADAKFIDNMNKVRKAIKENASTAQYSGYGDLPPTFLDEFESLIESVQGHMDANSGEYIVNRMTADELKALHKALKILKKYITTMNYMHNNAMFQHAYEAGGNSIDYMKELHNGKGRIKPVEKASTFMAWQNMRPIYAFERFGDGGLSVYDEFRQGQAQQAFLAKQIISFADEAYTAQEVENWSKEIKNVNVGGEEVKLPVTAIMSLYCLNKREQARTHIYGEGIRVATFTGADKKSTSDTGHIVTPEDVNRITNELTDRQKEVADQLQRYMSTECSKWGNYVTRARFDVDVFGEENYFPINSDGRYLAATADENPDNASLYALLNMGFTKELQEGATNRIILYNIFDVFANHTASMAQYRSFALPVLDALKWFNYKDDGGSVRDEMARVYGAPSEDKPGSGAKGYAEQFVLNMIRAYNGTMPQGDSYDSALINTVHHFNRQAVAFNVRVVIQQPMAITRAAMYVSPKHLAAGLAKSATQMKSLAEEMEANSGIAAWKSLGFYDTNISRGLTKLIKHEETAIDKVIDVGMKGAEFADRYTWAAMWYACKQEVDRSKYNSDEEYLKAVSDKFEDVVYRTQVVDSVMTKSGFLRSKSLGARTLGSFMSEPMTTMSMLTDAYLKFAEDKQRGMSASEAWQKNRGKIGKLLAVYAVGQVLLAVVESIADAWRDDDDYETFMQKWLAAFKDNAVDEILPFGKIPLISQLYNWIADGYDLNVSWVQWAQYFTKGWDILNDKISGKDTKYTWWGGIYNMLRGISSIAGLPFASASREVIDIWNNTVGDWTGNKLRTYDAGDKSNIKYAYLDGSLSYDDAFALLLEKGLAKDNDDAYWTIKGWDSGEQYFSKYGDLKAAAESGDKSTIKQQVLELQQHGTEDSDIKSSLTGYFKPIYIDASTAERSQIVDSLLATGLYGSTRTDVINYIARYWLD